CSSGCASSSSSNTHNQFFQAAPPHGGAVLFLIACRQFSALPSLRLLYNLHANTEASRLPEPALSPERYALAVITDDADLFRDVRKLLTPQFRTTLASSENDIKAALELPDLNAILFDLDCVGDGPTDGLDVLSELRKVREDVVLFAFARGNNRTLPL